MEIFFGETSYNKVREIETVETAIRITKSLLDTRSKVVKLIDSKPTSSDFAYDTLVLTCLDIELTYLNLSIVYLKNKFLL